MIDSSPVNQAYQMNVFFELINLTSHQSLEDKIWLLCLLLNLVSYKETKFILEQIMNIILKCEKNIIF